MRKTIWFWLCFIVAIIFATYFTTRTIMIKMGHGNGAIVHNIFIRANGASATDIVALRDATSASIGATDLDSMNGHISDVPGVQKSAVRRLPNGNLSIHAKMHNTIGLWTDGENFFPISDAGVIIEKPTPERTPGAIVFRGPVPNDITEITNVARILADHIDYLEWIEDRRWNIHTTSGITILLPQDLVSTPEYEPGAAISHISALNQNQNILSRKLTTIDLRDSKRVLVRK